MPNFFFKTGQDLPHTLCNFVFADMYDMKHQGTWVYYIHDGQAFQFIFYNTSGAQNDEIDYRIFAKEGTRTFQVFSTKGQNSGIASVYLNGVLQGTIDLYNATEIMNQLNTLPFTVTSTDFHTVKIKMESKNPSSGGYSIAATWLRIK